MREAAFRTWLYADKTKSTADTLLSDAKRVERDYGVDLDQEHARDGLADILASLRYTADDRDNNRPNPSRIDVPNIYKSLPPYRNAAAQYRAFCEANAASGDVSVPTRSPDAESEDPRQRLSLERDMQFALRQSITTLETGLEIIDGGAERAVEAGLIDITARDRAGRTVIIELKAGVANRQAVAQILSYMGSLSAEEGINPREVRGMLVAHEFDARSRHAARMVSDLRLIKYQVRFEFTPAD